MTGRLVEALRERGYRLTMARRAILRVLEESSESLSPLAVHARAQAYEPGLSLATVYRTLDLIDRLGLVQRVHTDQGCHEYSRAGDSEHHLVCRECGHVIQFPCEGLEPLIERVQQTTGYRVDRHILELSGVCGDCQGADGEVLGDD